MARQRNDARASMTIVARALHITKQIACGFAKGSTCFPEGNRGVGGYFAPRT